MRHWLATDPEVQAFYDGRTRQVPRVMTDQVRTHLGRWSPLPGPAWDAAQRDTATEEAERRALEVCLLCEPLTAEGLRTAVRRLLPNGGTTLAWPAVVQ